LRERFKLNFSRQRVEFLYSSEKMY